MTTPLMTSPARSNTQVVVQHVLPVLAAAASAAVVFVLGRDVLGITPDTVVPPRMTLGSVIGTAAVAAALGWSLLAALARWVSGGVRLWTWIAGVVALLSLLGPLATPGLTLGVVLHLVVATVTIVLLRRGTLAAQERRAD